MKSNIIVQGGIHTSGAQSIGDGPQAQYSEGMAERKSKQCHCSGGNANGSYFAGAQTQGQPVTHKAGNDGSKTDDHGDDPGVGNGNIKLSVHGGPGRSQQGIRKTEADKCQIDNG